MLARIKDGMRNALNMQRERLATCQLTLSPGYEVQLLRLRSRECSPPSCIPEENAPPQSCIRTQCWSRWMSYKKSGRHYSCMGRVSRKRQCKMLARIKNGMRNVLNMQRERIAHGNSHCLQVTTFHSYVYGVENAPLPSCIPVENAPPPSCIPVENAPPPSCITEENAPPQSCIRTQCWSRGLRYKKSGRHYSCMGRVRREGQCEMLA